MRDQLTLPANIVQVMGYIFRAISSGDRTALPPYIGQSLLLLLAPALYAASIYMVLGRVIAMLPNGERYSMIRLNWMTKIFVGGDVLSFLMQSTGGGILGTSDGDPDKVKFGEHVIVGGLFVQLAFFGFFMLVSVLFWFKYHRGEVIDRHVIETSSQCRWRSLLKVLFATSGLILIRSVFRVIEYLDGQDGYLLTREMFLYIFDGLLMFLVMVLFNWCFPGSVVRRKIKEASEETGSRMTTISTP